MKNNDLAEMENYIKCNGFGFKNKKRGLYKLGISEHFLFHFIHFK